MVPSLCVCLNASGPSYGVLTADEDYYDDEADDESYINTFI